MTDFPAWAAVGAEVLIVNRYYGQTNITRGTVSRHTKTRICVTANGKERQYVPARHRDGIWEEYGGGSSYSAADWIIDPASEQGKAMVSEHEQETRLLTARTACTTFDSKRTPGAAQAAVDALTTYLAGAAE